MSTKKSAVTGMEASVESFKLHIAKNTIDDLRQRLQATRWADGILEQDWERGTSPSYLRELVKYWIEDFDWSAQEAVINKLQQYRTEIDGIGIHFVHERGKGDRPLPLLLTHGYPDSFLRFQKLIPLLTDPAAHGGDPRDSFDVVVPSLPGYGLSDKPRKAGTRFKIAGLWDSLMTERLGYQHYGAHGGDWGSTVTEQLARSHSDSIVGIHLTDVPYSHLFEKFDDLSAEEEKFVAKSQEWQMKEGAYAMIQGSRPQSLAAALNDSPAGLAAWIVEKFRVWSDCHGDVESRFTKDELLTNITLYWATQTIGSSFELYYDSANAGKLTWVVEMIKNWTGSNDVPTGFASFPKDLLPPPRAWAERFFNIQRWTEMPRGGHFAAMEEPELLAEDLRAFFRPLRQSPRMR